MSDLDHHLTGLLGSVGKSIAHMPGARPLVEDLRETHDAASFRRFLETVDLGLGEKARDTVLQAASDETRWRDAHALLVRSAEQQLVERFSPSS